MRWMSPEDNPLPNDFPEEEGLGTVRWPWTQVYAVFPELAASSSSGVRQAEWVPHDFTRGGSEVCAAFALFKNLFICLFVCLFISLTGHSFLFLFSQSLPPGSVPTPRFKSRVSSCCRRPHPASQLHAGYQEKGLHRARGNGQTREIQLNKSQGARCSGQE